MAELGRGRRRRDVIYRNVSTKLAIGDYRLLVEESKRRGVSLAVLFEEALQPVFEVLRRRAGR